jgi:pyruvate dehydrogenase E2 component (dihydrolipoamide acetyltransferase)
MKEIKFVDVGEGITEGHIQKWLVKDGDRVKEDQPIVQVETDKAIVNVPSPIDGTVRIAAQEDTTVHLGDMVAYIGEPQELASIPQQQGAPAQAQAVGTAMPTVSHPQPAAAREIIATPAVRKLARDLDVDITKVAGTGPESRILENDIRNAANKETQAKPVPKFSEVLEEQHKGDIERIPMSQTRKTIARNMEASWTIPRAVHMDLIDATELFNTVQKEKPAISQTLNVKLTFLPFIIKALVEALKENPNFNASYDHERLEIIRKKYYNIGLAAEAPDGLKVVVIKNADEKGVIEIAKEIQALHDKIANKTVTLEEMRDSSFTITNVGSLGGGFLSVPMINYPEVAILGINLIRDMPVVKDGKIVIGKVLPFSISFDHRVVDGAEVVKFGNALIKYLQDPGFIEGLS